jgi:hypothetical protein
MPVTDTLPDPWYETPNIHHCTIRDFVGLCRLVGPTGRPRSATIRYSRWSRNTPCVPTRFHTHHGRATGLPGADPGPLQRSGQKLDLRGDAPERRRLRLLGLGQT